jgi:hypothetical protein
MLHGEIIAVGSEIHTRYIYIVCTECSILNVKHDLVPPTFNLRSLIFIGKGKGKDHPTTGHEDPEVE